MNEIFSVAATLNLTDNASAKLARFIEKMNKAQKASELLYGSIAKVNKEIILYGKNADILSEKMQKISIGFGGMRTEIKGVNAGFDLYNQRLSKSGSYSDKVAIKTERLTESMQKLNAVAKESEFRISKASGASVSAGAARHGSSSDFGAHMRTMPHVGAFGFTGPTLAATAAIYGGIGLGKSSYHHAKEYTQAMNRFEALGFGPRANAEADYYAKNAGVKGASYTDMLEAQIDAVNATKHPEIIQPIAEFMAKNKFANKSMYGRSVSHKQLQDLIRAAELSTGSAEPEVIKKRMDLFQKMYVSSGGRVTPSEIFNFIKKARTNSPYMTDSAFLGNEVVIQEMGGFMAGTATEQLYSSLSLGRFNKAQAKEWMRLGLLNKAKVEINKTTGLITKVNQGSIKGVDLAMVNDVEWVRQYLLPSLAKHGITDPKKINSEIRFLFGNVNASGKANLIARSLPKIDNAIRANNLASNTEELYQRALTTPQGNEQKFHAAWDNLMTSIGKLAMPNVISGIESLTKAVEFINKMVELGAIAKGFAAANAAKGFSGGGAPLGIFGLIGSGAAWAADKYFSKSEAINPNDPLANSIRTNTINAGGSQSVNVHSPIYLDGREIGRHVTNHIIGTPGTQPSQGSQFDPTMSQYSPMQGVLR